MHPVPLVRASVLLPLFEYLEQRGLRENDELALARSRLGDPLALIPLTVIGGLWETATRTTGLDDLGLRVGAASRPEDIGALGALVRREATLGAALDTAVRHGSLFNSGQRLWATREGDDVWIHHRFSPVLREGRRQASEFALMLWIELIRLGAGAGWRPTQLQLEGMQPRYAKELAALAAESVRFEQSETALAFPRSLLSLPLPALQPDPTSLPAPAAEPLPDLDFTGSARQAVAALLLIGSPHIEAAARAAGTSVRSLQRHLATAHLSFFALLEEARCDAAQRMLRDPSRKVIQISAELGYTDSANFTRAFRRWTGLSPRAFRRSVVGRDLTHQIGDLRPGVHAGLVERRA